MYRFIEYQNNENAATNENLAIELSLVHNLYMNSWNEYLTKIDKDKELLLVKVLNIAKKYCVDSVEAMPYGVPGLKLNNKPLIAVAAHKEHFGVYPFSPNVIKSAEKLIGNHETAEGTIRFNYGTFPSEDLIKELVELRQKEILC
ncbi:MAG: hypothetical protein PHC34_07890 [Candidatus Gastranaerophilales bacterium]|nr:hypothetical protein [Candidatus Gastranaerophilales bacterium]